MSSRIAIIALAALWAGPALAATKMHETVVHSFDPYPNARWPDTDLVADKDGNLYGTTPYGGANEAGSVFQLKPDGTVEVIWSFSGDGRNPNGIAIDKKSGAIFVTGAQMAVGAPGSLHRGERRGNKWKFENIFRFCDTTVFDHCPQGGDPGGPLTV